ncbi:MAG: glycosyltransferase [Paracoccus sp. (in: a-proteobacteria)]|nr:glycosyltransferase [Paracoccus sp. (in: a-proteobacteria)]
MPGAGIRMADMGAEPPVLLDVSRLVSRIGTGPLTGIDRVEAEWLAHIASRPHLLLCRVSRGQLLLPPEAGPMILGWIAGARPDARVNWRERLARRDGPVGRAMGALRGMALMRAGRGGAGLAGAASRALGRAPAYLNLGHANLDRALLASLAGLHRVVMIHDTIPLDHPEFTRPGQSEAFRSRFMTALTLADQIVTISDASAAQIRLWRGRLGVTRRAPILTAHIGTRLASADPGAIPQGLDRTRPCFVTLGTIEPRKNHTLLLDVWARLASDMPARDIPRLLILGRRGWMNDAVFARLDALGPQSPVTEMGGLTDGAVAALLEGSHALLMPSLAEGFGLPLTEAAGRGIPVLATPLPPTQEILGTYATYLPPNRPDLWAGAIAALAKAPPARMSKHKIWGWHQHFPLVEAVLVPPASDGQG